MDAATFLSTSLSNVNSLNVSFYDEPPDYETVLYRSKVLADICPKLTYRIVEFAGDYYY